VRKLVEESKNPGVNRVRRTNRYCEWLTLAKRKPPRIFEREMDLENQNVSLLNRATPSAIRLPFVCPAKLRGDWDPKRLAFSRSNFARII
jgi:hypothetical protein